MTNGTGKKLKLLIISVLNVLLLSLGHVFSSKILLLAALAIFCLSAIFAPRDDLLPILLFYQPWSPVLKLTPNTFTVASLIIPVVLLLILLEKDRRKLKYDIGISFVLVAYTLLVKLLNGLSLQTPYLFFIIMLFFVPIYFKKYKHDISFERCTLFLTAGILSACLGSGILMKYPQMIQYIEVINSKQLGLTRLSGFYGDPNYYSAMILVCIAAILLVLSKTTKKINIVFSSASIIALLYFGLQSVSKMFIISITSLMFLWLLCLLIEKRISYKVGMIIVVIVIAGIAITNNLFSQQLNYYLIRFNNVNDASSLTTGRIILWGEYFYYLLAHPAKLLFGIGLSNNQIGILLKTNDVHFTILQIIYQLGIIGGLILLLWWKGVYQELVKKTTMIFSQWLYFLIIAVAVLLPWFALDMLYAKEFFYFVLLLFLAKNYLSERPSGNFILNKQNKIFRSTYVE